MIVWLLSLLQVLKKNKWLQLDEYRVELNEGADMVFVLLLVLMMHDTERMSATMNAVSQIHSLWVFYPLMKLKTILQLLITNVSYVWKNELLHRTLGIDSLPSMNLALDKKRLVVNKHILHEFVYCVDHTYMYAYAILYIQCTSYICYVVKVDFVISIIYTHLNHW